MYSLSRMSKKVNVLWPSVEHIQRLSGRTTLENSNTSPKKSASCTIYFHGASQPKSIFDVSETYLLDSLIVSAQVEAII